MNDMPMTDNVVPNSMPEGCEEECLEMCKDKSIANIRAIGDFFYNKANELRDIAEKDLTIEDFEDAKKEDLDGDQGEGEGEGEEHGF